MNKPVLVIMAAGMGSRFGGMKQITPVDDHGHILMDFSLYDARLAGFEKVIFIIRKEHEAVFRESIGDRIAEQMEVAYAFQDLNDLPEGFEVPEGREKPWGTAHAVLSARDIIDGPFAVLNADDYYGRDAFKLIYDYRSSVQDDDKFRYAMVGYQLGMTLTESGHVARGVCEVDENGYLQKVTERTKIMKTPEGAAYLDDDEETWVPIDPTSTVSMNFWGYTASFMTALKNEFPTFLEASVKTNPLKCEYYLPYVVDCLLRADQATVQVLKTPDRWFGMTYQQDRKMVEDHIRQYQESGYYPKEF